MSKDAAALTCLADYEAMAKQVLSPETWAYVHSGAADQHTCIRNRRAYEDILLSPRHLRSMQGGNTALDLFGTTLDYPILLAPLAYQKLAHPEGEQASVLAASAMRAGMVVSTLSSMSLEDIAQASSTPLWFQLYLQADQADSLALIRRAEAAGYRALVITVDAALNGCRNAEQRAGFALPSHISAVNLNGRPAPAQGMSIAAGASLFQSAHVSALPDWSDIEWAVAQTRLPVLVKGIMSPHDARCAIQAGAAGLLVSNHGGRVLDTVPASIEALPSIVGAAGGTPVLLDGGIRRGTDVLKALALGAKAVMLGRPIIHGLAVNGPQGVAHVLHILRTEFEMAMVLCGRKTLSEIDESVIWAPAQ
ncbi:alpha-hydroxy acid oxidase [Pollutimonas harenae]|uniref:Alpha-hydroxy-acid oxidizing protein n=1 Tax=Pollutimonas harenae TaxID=657015 RepID=A0A853H1Y9_9BURK|nr:alpha-hydroxy acid oxidase [Pollutimonas harenae]NYT86966.1 alpha-hydroxy-acid oxidizing protein [Pollutimonas harenae]TEA69267.1 alpha-hydroxy-acid oxidizing protein [Pollutimonas harenae]